MDKILVIGAGGYIGTTLVPYLLEQGFAVRAVDRFFFGPTLDSLAHNPNLEIIRADIRAVESNLFTGVNTIIDLSGISNDPSVELLPEISNTINRDAPIQFAIKAKASGVTNYFYSSSCSVYGDGAGRILDENAVLKPISLYARTKVEAEQGLLQLNDADFNVTIMRNATVYGLSIHRMRFDLIINIMTLNAWKNNKIFVLGGGEQWRPLIHLQDLNNFFLAILSLPAKMRNGQIFNVGFDEQNYQVVSIAYKFRQFFDRLEIEIIPDDPDRRDYSVNFNKLHNTIAYKPQYDIAYGINEIKAALDNNLIKDTIATRTVQYYKYLLDAHKLIDRLKLNNRLLE